MKEYHHMASLIRTVLIIIMEALFFSMKEEYKEEHGHVHEVNVLQWQHHRMVGVLPLHETTAYRFLLNARGWEEPKQNH